MKAFTAAVSVVTGAASGIGREFACALADRGGQIVLADIDEPGLAATAELVVRRGGRAQTVVCDVRQRSEIEALAQATESWAGVPDLVVLNAGILVAGPLDASAADAIERMVEVNVLGVLHGSRIFGARMAARGRGHLLNVGSIAGLLPVPQLSAYAATKAAVVGLSESLHAELRPRGVGVTVLCPSFTRTALVASAPGSDEGMVALGQRMLDRVGARPQRVVAVALRAAARGRLYAVDTLHGRMLWRLKRTAPRLTARVAGIVSARL